jgi:hypothetical protein
MTEVVSRVMDVVSKWDGLGQFILVLVLLAFGYALASLACRFLIFLIYGPEAAERFAELESRSEEDK